MSELTELRAAHRDSYPMGNIHHGTPERPDWGTFCVECVESWPCTASQLLDRLAAVTARAEAAEAKVARIEAVIEPAWRTNLGHACDTTTEAYAAGRNGLLDDLRAALADEGDTDE